MQKFLNCCFSKYHHLGNDFIFIDDRAQIFPFSDKKLITSLCERKFGIGADGLVLLTASVSGDFRMRIFNSDGSEAESCGNALLSLFLFLKELKCAKKEFLIETQKGLSHISEKDNEVILRVDLPIILGENKTYLDGEMFSYYLVDSGVPHVVIFVEDVKSIDVTEKGTKIRHHSLFQPKGANVDFAAVQNRRIFLRTYERGVEGETFACGTGALAAAMSLSKALTINGLFEIIFKHGSVKVNIQDDNAELIGRPQFVFSGISG